MAQAPTAVTPTPDERRNGWTVETLTAYLDQRASERADYAKLIEDATPRRAVSVTTRDFNPHDWLS